MASYAPPPNFVPFGSSPGPIYNPAQMNAFGMGGIVGGLIVGAIIGGYEHTVERANLRRCMGYKGYKLYGLSRDLWHQVNTGSAEEIEQRFALIAAGPEPSSEAIDP